MRTPSRRTWYGIAVAVAVLVVVVAAVAVLLAQRQRQHAALTLDAAGIRPESPAVSARYGAWTDRGAKSALNAIVLYDSATGETRRITDGTAECSQPTIATDTVVYADYRSGQADLYRYDVASASTSPFLVAPGRQSAPSAGGGWVAWEDARTGYGSRVRAKRLAGGTEVVVPTSRAGAIQRRPRVGAGFVVCEEYDSDAAASGNARIVGYDLERGGRPTVVAGSSSVHLLPATDGRYVVWSEQRGPYLVVAGWDRTTGKRFTAPVQRCEQTTPAIMDGVVYWIQPCQRRHFEVYAWTVGSAEASTAYLPGPGSVDQLGIQARDGSLMWLEHRSGTWYVRGQFKPGQPGAASASMSDRPHPPSPLAESAVAPRVAPAARLLLVQDTLAPTAPAHVVASAAGTGSVTVSWSPATDNVAVVAYDVYRAALPVTAATLGSATKVASVATSPATVAVASDEVAVKYTLYYAVVARDAAGNSAISANSVPDPHGTSRPGASLETCQRCHLGPDAVGPDPAARQSCYVCHGNTPSTALFGAQAPFDAQAAFYDDTATALPATGSRHRNQFMIDADRACDGCHTPHRKPYDPDPANNYTALLRTQLATAPAGQSGYRYNTAASPVGNGFCLDCHGLALTPIALVGGSTAYINAGGDHETGWASSAHGSKVATPNTDPGIQCEACHDKHGSAADRLLGRYDPATGANVVNGARVTGDDNSVCLACHAGSSAGYPTPVFDTSGFPTRGTWPGGAVWGVPYDPTGQTGSMHSSAGVVWPGSTYAGGDCKNCHRMHGPSGRFDILRDTSPEGNAGAEPYSATDFSFCLDCHDGSPGFDISRYIPSAAGGTGTGARAGHATKSAGKLPAGSALPCYDCHNPHGTASAYGLAVITQVTPGTTTVIGDAAGELTMGPGRTDANVRQFCLSCHTTADSASGWNGTAFVGIPSGALVEGIDRVSTLARLRLPSVSGHNSGDTQACYTCHGNDYSSASSSNVHNLGGGVSQGGVGCYSCHSSFKETMDLSGTQRTSWYHHVLGTGGYNGGTAPGTGSYPTTVNASAQEVYCVSCHADHNYFNASRGANLRVGIGAPGSQTTNTDFSPAPPYGICVSCHSVSFTRDNANQKAGGGASTLQLDGPDFAASTHDYTAQSSFSGSAFLGNCVKCHSDGRPTSFQGTSTAFALHYSLDSRLNQAMGLSVPTTWTNTGSTACYRCHSTASADNPNTAAGKDWYGVAVMTPNARSMHQAVQQTYSHPVDGNPVAHTSNEVTAGATWPWSNRHVTCEDCHNVHASRPGTHTAGVSVGGPAIHGAVGVKPSWPASANFATPTAYAAVTLNGGTTDWEAYLCFKCHSSYGGTPAGTSPSGAPRTDLAKEFDPNNFSYHRVLGTDMSGIRTSFLVSGTTYTWDIPNVLFVTGWNKDAMLTCTDCHTGNPAYARGPHGSSVQFTIDPKYPVLWGTTNARLQSSSPGMNSQLICAKCHVLFNGSQWGNNVHSRGDHQSVPCTYCHVGVPHGWKRPRLIGYTTDPAPYGHRQGLVTLRLRTHTNSSGYQSGWQTSDCYTNCGFRHNSSVSPVWP